MYGRRCGSPCQQLEKKTEFNLKIDYFSLLKKQLHNVYNSKNGKPDN